MIPLRMLLTMHSNTISGRLTSEFELNFDWTPSFPDAAFRQTVTDAVALSLKFSGIIHFGAKFYIKIVNASVPDCDTEPRALVFEGDDAADLDALFWRAVSHQYRLRAARDSEHDLIEVVASIMDERYPNLGPGNDAYDKRAGMLLEPAALNVANWQTKYESALNKLTSRLAENIKPMEAKQ